MEQEIEIKLRLSSSPDEIRRLVEASGAVLERERSFEDNVLYDDGLLSLARAGCILRLRRTEGAAVCARLTYKEPAGEPEGRYKVRGEAETEVSDPESLDTILRKLRFTTVYRYQKYRTTFRLGGVEIALDETPIGSFLELEGSREGIDAFARLLGYAPSDYINLSYRALQEQAFAGTGREPGDMIFPET